MKKNMGSADRFTRTAVAAVIAVLYFKGIISGVVAVVLIILAAVFVITSIIGYCPLYTVLGLNTCSKHKNHLNKEV